MQHPFWYRAKFTILAMLLCFGCSTFAATNVLVRVGNYFFNPAVTNIQVGDSITWSNISGINHDSTSTSDPEVWRSGTLGPGDTFTKTFTEAGTFPYHCEIHQFSHPEQSGTVMVAAAPNQPPTATITIPTNNQAFLVGSNVLLQAAASDSDGTVSSVEFRTNGTPLGTALGPFDFTFTNPAPGNYTLTARATDNLGAMSTSGPVNIFVLTNALLSPPTFTNGQAQFTISGIAGQTYIIDASTNLSSAANWVLIATTNAPSSLFLFMDPAATTTQRFYRARQNY